MPRPSNNSVHLSHQTTFNRNGSGTKAPTVIKGISPRVFYLLVTVLLCTNAATILTLLMGDEIAQITNKNANIAVISYETRIADLRTEIDRLNSRQYARAGDFNLQMQDLVSQQEELAVQHQYIRALAKMAEDLGIDTASVDDTADTPTLNTSQLAPANDQKHDVESVRATLASMSRDTDIAISAIAIATKNSTQKLLNGLSTVGIHPLFDNNEPQAVGGPFESLENMPANEVLNSANAIVAEFHRFEIARQALRDAPVHRPVKGNMRISSTFGARKDPFLDKTGFHSGLDFAASTGTKVSSAGAGTVVFAGVKGGYGNMIEVEHENGLTTRYGHLSKILVKKGQTVTAGANIGLVGSTGRSTGPHLHFEVRRSDTPLNPQKFLNAGQKLQRYL